MSLLTTDDAYSELGSHKDIRQSPNQQNRRESWVSIGSRRNSRVLQNDLCLHEAVIKNEPDAVKRVLKEPVDVNCRNNYGRAPIHWASSRGSTEIMEMLINAKCDIEAQDKYGMRPILMAAWHGHKDAVEMLINCGASVMAINKKQYTLLMCAAKNNRLDVINFLLDTLEDVVIDEVDIENQTALHHAAAGGHVDVVKRLVEIGAEVNAKDKSGRNPLHLAAEKGHVEVVEYLLPKEADMEARDNDGNVAIHLSTENKQTRVTQVLLEYGTSPDTPNEKGLTPLHIACNLGCRGIIDSLIQHGSNLNAQSKTGNTPLHLACRSNESDIVELLISKGADINLLNIRLESPIHIAAEHGYSDLCKMLLAAGANIQQREQGGKTPLYIAARGSFTAIVDMIIKTARLDYPSPEDDSTNVDGNEVGVLKSVRRKWRGSADAKSAPTPLGNNEKLRSLLYRIAYKHLSQGEWKRLALHWAFTDEQIRAIEHQYTGPSSYKEHGFRMMLIWAHGLGPDANPVKELYESLIAIDNKKVADAVRRNLDKENESMYKSKNRRCYSCAIL